MCSSIARVLAVAVVVLAVGASLAGANRFQLAGAESGFRITFSQFEVLGGFNSFPVGVHCPVTLEGTFHSTTILKIDGSLIGMVTRAAVDDESCETLDGALSARLTLLPEMLPWHVRYHSFTGTLPSVEAVFVDFLGVGVQLDQIPGFTGQSCLYEPTTEEPMAFMLGVEGGGTVEHIGVDQDHVMPFLTGNWLLCEGDLAYEGIGTFTQTGGSRSIVVRLV